MNQQARNTLFIIAAICLLAGAILHFVQWFFAPYLFALGAAGITLTYLTQPTKEMDFRKKRLHRYNIFAGLLMIVASSLMFSGLKEWILCLTISAILMLYSAFAWPKDNP